MIWIYMIIWLSLCCNSVTANVNCPDVENKDEVTFTVDSKCYEYVESLDTEVSFAIAAEDCQQRDGRLVTIKDNNTQAELVDQLEYISDSYLILIGLRRLGSEWRWITGETLSYNNWNMNSICNGTCACAAMNLSSGGLWERHSCETSKWFTVHVCEYGTSRGRSLMQSHLILAIVFVVVTIVIHGR